MPSAFTDILTGFAAGGRGYLDEKKRQEAQLFQLRKQAAEEDQFNQEMGFKNRMLDEVQKPQAMSEIDARGIHAGAEDTESDAMYGDSVIPGGLKRYDIEMPMMRDLAAQEFLLGHPGFKTNKSRFSVRESTPGSNSGELTPKDLLDFRLNYMKIAAGGDQGLIPPKPAERDARLDSMATGLGIKPYLNAPLQAPNQANVSPRPAPQAKTNKVEEAILSEIQASNDDPGMLLKEFEADYKKNPRAFKGVDLNRVRSAIRAKGNKRAPVMAKKKGK